MLATETWSAFLKQIRELMKTDDIKNFLSWGPIR